jgi:hypothetical protein
MKVDGHCQWNMIPSMKTHELTRLLLFLCSTRRLNSFLWRMDLNLRLNQASYCMQKDECREGDMFL